MSKTQQERKPMNEGLEAKYHDSVAHHDAARRAASEKKQAGGSGSELWVLNLAALEAEQACVELVAEINRAYDPALERLRVLLIDELEKASRELAQLPNGPLNAQTIAPLSEPTPGDVLGRVDALLAVETDRRRRDAICARLRLLFRVADEAQTLIGAERRARKLPGPPRLFELSPVGAPPSPSTSPECAALIQHINACRSAVTDQKLAGLRAGIIELRARIRDYLAEQKRKDAEEVKARAQHAARKADEERALKQSHGAAVVKYAAQDAEAAKLAARQASLTPEEIARAAVA
jgi:hypothetical protein